MNFHATILQEIVDSELMSGEKLNPWNKTELVLMEALGLQRIGSWNTRHAEKGSLKKWSTEKCVTIRNAESRSSVLSVFYMWYINKIQKPVLHVSFILEVLKNWEVLKVRFPVPRERIQWCWMYLCRIHTWHTLWHQGLYSGMRILILQALPYILALPSLDCHNLHRLHCHQDCKQEYRTSEESQEEIVI